MKPTPVNFLAAALLCLGSGVGSAAEPAPKVDAIYLAAHHIVYAGKLVDAKRVDDRVGEHLLVLSRKAAGADGHIELAATYYGRKDGRWQTEWTVRDSVDCPILDHSADFVLTAIRITDLNHDGRSEVTIPYKLFCSGGVDYSTVKVILREGATKLAIRGELEFHDNAPALEGRRQYDPALLQPANAAYKKHLDGVWKALVRLRD
ncbi:M949_RS01915 family surface polysaccharide biosynthesis protein [Duganella sp. S19_KUP01_CR8]|uniref:M949_RS01915 family surface polysaccharide biosynthesis protein n=1 Tax=Duganella sp. S19_KUP01_CR8 TaxID=3025502 RepID=UPI002FCDB316